MKQYPLGVSYGLAGLFCYGAGSPAIAQAIPARLTLEPATASVQCAVTLRATIDKIIEQPALRTAYWGILVQPLGSSRPLYGKNADHLFLPASNAKLLTTAAALIALPATLPNQTPFYATGQAPTLRTLRAVGRGDPSLSDRTLDQIAAALQSKGVRSIDTLIGDDSFFQGRRLAPSWSWEDLQGGDGLPVNSLILNANVISVKVTPQAISQPLRLEWLTLVLPSGFETVQNLSKTASNSQLNPVEIDREEGKFLVQGQLQNGSGSQTIEVPVPNPGLAFLETFQAVLKRHQIQVNRLDLTAIPSPQPGEVLIASAPFPRLEALITEANQQSNNLYAETLLRLLGTAAHQSSMRSTPDRGLTVLKQTLTRLGIDPNSYELVDGSGLSRKNLVSPKSLVDTLRAVAQSQSRTAFRSSLAVAGQSGTLSRRFLNTLISGHLYGKTGTIAGVSALSGYLEMPSSPPLALSILVNHSAQPNAVLRNGIDQIVIGIAQAKGCQ